MLLKTINVQYVIYVHWVFKSKNNFQLCNLTKPTDYTKIITVCTIQLKYTHND